MTFFNDLKRRITYSCATLSDLDSLNEKTKPFLQGYEDGRRVENEEFWSLIADFLVKYKDKPLFFFDKIDVIDAFFTEIIESIPEHFPGPVFLKS